MKSSKVIFLGVPALAWACGTAGGTGPQAASGAASGFGAQSGSSASGGSSGVAATGAASGTPNAGAGATSSGTGGSGGSSSGDTGSGSSSGTSTGAASGAGSGVASSGAASSGATTGASSGSVSFDGGVNMVPATYTGKPFTQNVIPGFIYAANYDKGGPAVAYCHTGTGTTPATCGGAKITDWCCSDTNPQMMGARCDDRNQALGVCPTYRPDSDNAGLSHMNLGEVDTYAAAGPTWVMGANGPTLTGPAVTVGTPVPQHANATTQDDTYLSYTNTGEWQKYTVEVLAAGTYSIGALMGTPPNVKVTLDFGNGVTTGVITLPASPVSAACKCAEAYHAWNPVANFATVIFPAAGTYLLTMTLNAGNYNPLYYTFTKM